MSEKGSSVPIEERRFKLAGIGTWPYSTMAKYAESVTSVKGNPKPLEEIGLEKSANVVIKGDTIKITRIA